MNQKDEYYKNIQVVTCYLFAFRINQELIRRLKSLGSKIAIWKNEFGDTESLHERIPELQVNEQSNQANLKETDHLKQRIEELQKDNNKIAIRFALLELNKSDLPSKKFFLFFLRFVSNEFLKVRKILMSWSQFDKFSQLIKFKKLFFILFF